MSTILRQMVATGSSCTRISSHNNNSRLLLLQWTGSCSLFQPLNRRSICHKDHIDPEIREGKPAPFPYDRKKFGWWRKNMWRLDRCVRRWDENSVVVCIEGLMGSGKQEFGKKLADACGMRFYGMPTVDPILKTDDGFDHRTLNWLLPEAAQYVDQKMLYLNPYHSSASGFYGHMFVMKLFHQLEGLTHLFNTGEGVVHEGSLWSDFAFSNAAVQMNFQAADVKEHHYDLLMACSQEINRPHVVIYLSVPPEEALANFRDKSPEEIRNSPLVTLEYFQRLDELWQRQYLPEMNKHAEILIYDWSGGGGDIDMVIEDLEQLDFWRHEDMTEKIEDWRRYFEDDFDAERLKFTSSRQEIYGHLNQPVYDKPSCIMSQDAARYRAHMLEVYGPKYDTYFDPRKVGWLKTLLNPFMLHHRIRKEHMYFGTSLRNEWTQLQVV